MNVKVIKIGGNVVDNPEKLEKFLRDFATIKGAKILVHGGGKIATQISKSVGIEAQMIDGRRVTDAETLKVVIMVYAGLINKNIVAKLRSENVDAIGMCGADGGLIVSNKRKPNPVDYGYVGDPIIDNFSVKTAKMYIDNEYTMVVAPITISTENELLNTNADTIASTIAQALAKEYETELVYCFEKRGVLTDVNDDNSVISEITPSYFEQLKSEGVIVDGMLPKLTNAFKAIDNGVAKVVICSSEAVAEPGYGGTTLVK
ncbi:MAG: acetylglutamate kinase [Rikenellaceae bacterium]